ncbi:hypothetical protein BJV85_001685 [Clostridium acetobutylicum]|uniref:Uncharacterized conserved protein n=1 Tax=Clostridium acetobutylicum (strain ATCC 824 / DSM 792 / JCM 1419 / IAM 19013 / LMG 5710 / NBRC 13948 / NRRL B-527 / VKM B-1787 / 2291 / W) TaxID=272562 RepID=Q97H18_CLOAB|nr:MULTISPECIES: motility associated factor glycosyltransferase family protein [Clostridium]AAK80153.1 Uncharacterized conserved protein [Clostridium acetobutylicum ATCC 824]ADZ21247.1 Conserved hypothetical protein [Clostridium acetobutylicum EA 2018]AEI32225.1 hypothetical protein SMB_G2229 [Clostridium acetobutylicum DSM 1731]AWV79421.1 DUF115 domain-containing protein [Clostridium acetobutylicum]MBC2394607.1 motility associated factor glycosyltransferase family protein [Clostridium acetobu
MNEITKNSIEKSKKENLEVNYVIEKSKDNKNVLKVIKDGKSMYMGSKYNASRDIEDIFNKIEDGHKDIAVIFGLGSGEYIKHILHMNNKLKKIVVIEPDFNTIKAFTFTEYFNEIVNDKRFYLCPLLKDEFFVSLSSILKENEVSEINYIVFPNYNRIYGDELKYCTEILQHYIDISLSNKGTNEKFSKLWFQCYVKNLRYIVKSTPVYYLNNLFKGLPAVIVSAGPSLEKNISYLKEYQNKCVIISGGRTLKPLLELGISPDFVCIIDPADIAYQQIKDYDYSRFPLVYFEKTNWRVVENHKGNKIINSYDENLKRLLGTDVGALDHGGSVAHNCLGLAVKLGCNPIIMIGQDFAYTNDKTHAGIASLESEIESSEELENEMYVKDVFGEMVKTDSVLNMYRKTMEEMIKIYSDREYINCTEGGAYIEGTKIGELKKVLHNHCKSILNKDISSVFLKSNNVKVSGVIKELKNTLKEGEKIIESIKDINKEDKGYEKIRSYIEKHFLLNYVCEIGDENKKDYSKLSEELMEDLKIIEDTIEFIK